MDIQSFINTAVVAGVPLIFVIVGLVEWLKKLGVTGIWLTISSMVIGLLLGVGYYITVGRPPIGDPWLMWGYWFAVIIFGLAMGVVASGLYDAVKNIISSIFVPKDLPK